MEDFKKAVESSTETPPEGGFERLLASKDASEKLAAFQEGRSKPASFGTLVEILSNAIGKNRFRLADELKIDGSTWNKVMLGQDRPDLLPARTYSVFAKTYNVTLEALKMALEGSFQLMGSGISDTAGTVFTRSGRKSAKNTDVTAAMHELLQKAGRTGGALDQKAVSFLKEIELWMKM